MSGLPQEDETTSSSSSGSGSQGQRKRVQFAETQTLFFGTSSLNTTTIINDTNNDEEETVEQQDDKRARWYTQEELVESREEARLALQALQQVQGDVHSVDPQRHCLRGIEKFGNVMAKLQTQRVLKESILTQQRQTKQEITTTTTATNETSVKTCPEQLAVLSRYLSQPSRDLAHLLALASARELGHDVKDSTFSSRPTTITTTRSKDETGPVWISPRPPANLMTSSAIPPTPSLLSPDTSSCVRTGSGRHFTTTGDDHEEEEQQQDREPSHKKPRLLLASCARVGGMELSSCVPRQVSE